MPRDQIQFAGAHESTTLVSAQVGGEGEPTTEVVQSTAPLVHVTWHPDGGWVQLAFECDPGWLEMVVEGKAGLQETGRDTILLYSEVLNRFECNALVRSVRRARDKAYGRDE